MKVVIPADPNFAPFDYERERLGSLGIEVALCGTTEPEIVEAACDAEVLCNTGNPLSRAALEALPRLRLVAFYGIGTDYIDVEAATELGIVVCNAPRFGVEEVADHALTLLLACARRLFDADRAVRRGDWDWSSLRPLRSLASQTVGVVGFGNIGRALGRKVLALGCRVLFFDPYVPQAPFPGPLPAALDELLRESDYVSIHVPRTPQTTGLIGERELRLMKPTAYLVNTARGAIVDETALVRALRERWIAGAGLDVFVQEPLPLDHPLIGLDNAILTPHIAGTTEEAFTRLHVTACEAIERLYRGEWPDNVVNPGVRPRVELRRVGQE